MQGRAADLIVPGLSPLAVCQTAQQMKLPCVQTIHEFGRWAHLTVELPSGRPNC
jgi:zinc D-Ala-D-Ala carboxypeptidase